MESPLVIPPQDAAFFGVVLQLVGAGALAASQVGASDSVQISGDADFVSVKRAAVWSPVTAAQVKLQFEIVPGERLFQAPLFLGGLATGRYPQYFNRRIPSGAMFTLLADDRQTVPAQATIRTLHAGYKLYARPFEPARFYTECDEMLYVADYTAQGVGAIGANLTFPTGITIQRDHDFWVQKLGIICDSPAATIDLVTSGKNLGWFNRPCHVGMLAATDFNTDPPAGAWPFVLPVPCFVPAAGTITCSVADLSGATNRVQVLFIGKRLKPAGGIRVAPNVARELVTQRLSRSYAGAVAGDGGMV